MEKSEAIRRFNEGKHYIETCIKDIASLELNNDKELRKVLRGTAMVEVSYKAVENFCKVGSYVIDGEDGAQKLKGKLINLKEQVLQLYDGADKNNLMMIKRICETIISEINEVEEWTDDNEQTVQRTNLTDNIDIPETGENKDANDEGDEHENNYPDFNYELKRLFKTEEIFKSFYDKSKDLSPENIASLYSDQSNVLNPHKRGVAKTLYDTFVNPNQDADKIVYETFLRYLRKSDTE